MQLSNEELVELRKRCYAAMSTGALFANAPHYLIPLIDEVLSRRSAPAAPEAPAAITSAPCDEKASVEPVAEVVVEEMVEKVTAAEVVDVKVESQVPEAPKPVRGPRRRPF